MTVTFGYDRAIFDRFPSLVGGIIHATDLNNGTSPEALGERYRAEQDVVAARLATLPVAEIPSIAAWRRTFTACGVKPTQHRVAAEALLRRLHKSGNIPSINILVDIGNLVSIRYGLPVAVFDQAQVTGRTTVRFATGEERFTDLGASEPVAPEAGEIVFVDDAGLVSARRWCWRQSAQSATSLTTTEALVTVEAHHDNAREEIEEALADILILLAQFQPETGTSSEVLERTRTTATFPPH